jgi:hypothetical protein
LKYSRITIETAGGNRVDIVKDVTYVVSGAYILYADLEKFVQRVREFGVKIIDVEVLKVLAAEKLFHFRTDL